MFFCNKSKILTILFIVKYEKITLFDEFLVVLGPIISRFFACSNEEKNKQKQQRVLALDLYGNKIECFQMSGILILVLCLYFRQRPDLSQLTHSSMTCYYAKLRIFAGEKRSSLLLRALNEREKSFYKNGFRSGGWRKHLSRYCIYSQHFIFFVIYKCVQKS